MHQIDRTPSFVIDEKILLQDLQLTRKVADAASCNFLYSPKACSVGPVLEIISGQVDGFACSSSFELRLIDQIAKPSHSIHLVSPLITEEIVREIGDRLQYVTLNSLSQLKRLKNKLPSSTRTGLRVNPQLSFLSDSRYDPCRPNSKLGVPMSILAECAERDADDLRGINGLHFHTNCDETDFASLLATVRHICDVIPRLLDRVTWVNIGGGYLFNEAQSFDDFFQAVAILREDFELDVFMEPGAGVVRRAGTIEASVQDIFESEDATIAILDTSVNHMAEVFEFQYEPDVLGHIDGGVHTYILTGCTCLAGDLFGEYSFDTPLEIGSRLRFLNMGAYTISKAHRFNGVGLPSIYIRQTDDTFRLIREDKFDDFAKFSGVESRAIV